MSDSISKRLKRDRELNALAAKYPNVADSLATARAIYGDDWDPASILARRVRATRAAEDFLLYVAHAHAALGEPVPDALLADYFETTHDLLTKHCDPAFGALTWPEARRDLKPKAGPQGAAGVIARWSVRVGAFDDGGQDWHVAAKRFRAAITEARNRVKRTRAK